jgi:hypothetical protein
MEGNYNNRIKLSRRQAEPFATLPFPLKGGMLQMKPEVVKGER